MSDSISGALGGIGDVFSGAVKTVAPYGGLIGGALGGPMGALAGGALGSALGGSVSSNALGGVAGSLGNSLLSGPQTAAAPDYMGLAKLQAAGSHTNQNGPFGNVNYTANPDGTWTQNTSYNPQVQQAMMGQYGLANSQNATLQNAFNSGMFNNMGQIDTSKLAAAPVNAGMTAQNAIMSRLQPQMQHQNEALQAQLANQGIGEGSDAYQRAMTQQSQNNNDLMSQAAAQGISLDQNARNQGLNEQISMQNQPLNYFNSLRSGSQVSAPNFGTVNGSGVNALTAGQNQYNAGLNSANASNAYNNNMLGGLFSMGGSLMSSPTAQNALGGLFGNNTNTYGMPADLASSIGL
jgi:hypothetical protein